MTVPDVANGNQDNKSCKTHEVTIPARETQPSGESSVTYGVEDVPPWYLCILLGFQHYLTAFGSTISVPLVLYKSFCMDEDTVGLSELISTIFFVSGIATLLQTTFGTRERVRKMEKIKMDGSKGNVKEPFIVKSEKVEIEKPVIRDMYYTVNETPPWHCCALLGFQHFMTALGGQISVPLILAPALCMDKDLLGLSWIICTYLMVAGVATCLQSTIGIRLPIIQGATFAFLTPTFSILALPKWDCPYIKARELDPYLENSTLAEPGSPEHRELWQLRIREIQGAIMVASLFQVVIGFSGLMGFVLKFIGPLAITPTITLVGLALFKEAADKAAEQWYIALMTMCLIAIFSQYMRNVNIPCFAAEKGKGCKVVKTPIFSLFPVLLAMITSWIICVILTESGALTDKKGEWGYNARTDIKSDVLHESEWFRFPYPGQWGMPTVSTAAVFGMLAGVLSSMIESVGDYYACARLAGAPPPPVHAVNRGIGIEGIGCILAGAWGSGNGTTSYSENVGAIGITKVGSRIVVQVGGIIMIFLGCLGKFGALFVTIPDPVVGGMFMIMFGMITAVGLSNLQYVNLNSSRNIFILGVSLFFGLSFPKWVANTPGAINTGSEIADQIISVLLGTSMFVGGFVGFVLDNTIPGTAEERGINKWRKHEQAPDGSGVDTSMHIYDLPLIQKYLDRVSFFRYVPFCPRFSLKRRKDKRGETEDPVDNQNATYTSRNGENDPQFSVNSEKSSNTYL